MIAGICLSMTNRGKFLVQRNDFDFVCTKRGRLVYRHPQEHQNLMCAGVVGESTKVMAMPVGPATKTVSI